MKISKKLVSFMLALAMVVTAMAVQTVPVQAKAKALEITNVKNAKKTLYIGDDFRIETNYKKSQIKVTTSNKKVVTINSTNRVWADAKGTAKVTVSLKKNPKVKKTITVKVSDKYYVTYTNDGKNEVKEFYNPKTKKSTYKVSIHGTDNFYKSEMNASFQFTTSARGMRGSGFAGEMYNREYKPKKYESTLRVYNATDDKELSDFEHMTNKDWFKVYDENKAEIKKSKVEREENEKYYKVIVITPSDLDNTKSDYDLYIKNKENGKIYTFDYHEDIAYSNGKRIYNVLKKLKIVKIA